MRVLGSINTSNTRFAEYWGILSTLGAVTLSVANLGIYWHCSSILAVCPVPSILLRPMTTT